MNINYIGYLIIAIIIWGIGYLHTGRFVRPKWKIPGKFLFYIGVSLGLAYWLGHYSLIFIIGHQLIGLAFHWITCKRHDINWITCEPRERYLALQEQWAKGDFKKPEK